jgi:hypothetical protein
LIAQYTKDTNFTIKASQVGVFWLLQNLELFSFALGLFIDESKSIGFWLGEKQGKGEIGSKDLGGFGPP